MESSDGRYEISTAKVPTGWSNQSDQLGVNTYFADKRMNETLNPFDYFSRPLPILTDNQSEYIFEEEGRGFYVWNEISGKVAKIEESSLEDIITKLEDGGLHSLKLSSLKTVDSPSGEPTSNVPYPLDPDFIDRPSLTDQISMPPQRYIRLCGWMGSGKSQLAIQYANKVRNHSLKTWVFWVCAVTKQKLNDDLAAIADILPERSTRDVGLNRMEQVLQWLCTQHQEPWLMVVDQASAEAGVQSVLDKLLSSSNGSFIITTNGGPFKTQVDLEYMNSALVLRLKSMDQSEALQLLQKKLKIKYSASEIHDLVTTTEWSPLSIQLTTTCFNLRLIEPYGHIKLSRNLGRWLVPRSFPLPHDLLVGKSFQLLHDHLVGKSPTAEALLYFVSFFNPPEVRALWLQSYLESREEFDELEDSLELLTKLSLLAETSGGNAYKMHPAVQHCVITQLLEDRKLYEWEKEIESFVDSRKFIPSPNPSGFRIGLGSQAEDPSEGDKEVSSAERKDPDPDYQKRLPLKGEGVHRRP